MPFGAPGVILTITSGVRFAIAPSLLRIVAALCATDPGPPFLRTPPEAPAFRGRVRSRPAAPDPRGDAETDPSLKSDAPQSTSKPSMYSLLFPLTEFSSVRCWPPGALRRSRHVP